MNDKLPILKVRVFGGFLSHMEISPFPLEGIV